MIEIHFIKKLKIANFGIIENTIVEAGCIYAGVPAKKVKDISQELINGEINRIADNYLMYSSWFKEL